jgi:hypothetical protein
MRLGKAIGNLRVELGKLPITVDDGINALRVAAAATAPYERKEDVAVDTVG